MKQIQPSDNAHQWPRCKTESIKCRKRDLVVRIADWSNDKDEPAFDVEVYIGGVYDFNESKTFAKSMLGTMAKCQAEAKAFAAQQIAKLL